MSGLVALPLVVMLASSVAALAFLRYQKTQEAIALTGMVALVGAAGWLLAETWDGEILVLQAANWPAPFGITLVADLFASIMVMLAAIVGLAATMYSVGTIDADRERYGYYPLMNILVLGVCGAFLTGDLFNLYVWFEVLLVASFVIMALGGGRPQMEGALKYVALNLVSSVLFLSGVGLLYAATGTLNMADLSLRVAEAEADGYMTAVAMLFLTAFGIKAAMFPLFFWLPASYHTAPAPVAALFAGLLTKVGVYALIRVFTLIFTTDVGYTHTIILWLSVATMVTGVLGAVSHNDVKRILSFHIISQIGYMTLGLALFTPLALAGSIFYIGHHIIVKTNLFFVAGVIRRLGGSYELAHLGGLARSRPALAALFFIPAFSLGGIPPLSGFFAKFVLVRAAADEREFVALAFALGVGLLTLLSMTKIFVEAFLKPAPEEPPAPAASAGFWHYAPIAGLAALTLVLGFAAEPFLSAATEAADQLMEPQRYITAVLGEPQ
ncbi:MAG: Na+/H+ antiporter subunit D [Dehalococcoidia bacterium]|nr:Na+/H+ antiporter subunit D [Dehalococcoidia bacterium]